MPEMEELADTALDQQIAAIKEVLANRRGQFLLVGPDDYILNLVKQDIQNYTTYDPVSVVHTRHASPQHKIFFLKLTSRASIEYQSLLYHYLELPLRHDCFVCLISSDSLCLNSLEKRVKSRFKNNIFFIPYVDIAKREDEAEDKDPLDYAEVDFWVHASKPPILQTIEAQEKEMLRQAYDLPRFNLAYILDLFEPVHFALIYIASKQKLIIPKVVEQYRKLMVNFKQLKGVCGEKIVFCCYDLLEAEIINRSGKLAIDYSECRDYITKHGPHYLRSMYTLT